jgi:glycosyltransferase involved in cell wall biosynthesis
MCKAMASPRVSYIVAAYNHEEFIGQLLRSILAQTFSDLELIVIDDGSLDSTAQIAFEIASTDQRMQAYSQENKGVVAARNRGVLLSRGEYVSIVDSDDLLPLERTQWQVQVLDSNPQAAMVYGDAWIIDENDDRIARFFDMYPPISGDFSVELLANYCFVPAISVMFRRSAFDKSGLFWGPGSNADYLKWIELGLLGDVVCLLDKKLGCWRKHDNNFSRTPISERVQQYENLCTGLQSLAQKHPELAQRIGEKRLRWRYGRCHFMGAFYAGLDRSWDLARIHFTKAYHYYPSLFNGAAWLSTFPVFNLISIPFFRFAARKIW